MSYELLRGLYLGAATNADLTTYEQRLKFHVRTELDRVLPEFVSTGRDVVITGNPGDGKSHLVRYLIDRKRLPLTEVELDLSATSEQGVQDRWRAARAASRPFVLCGNEGPLKSLLVHMQRAPELASTARELQGQLGRLVASSPLDLPRAPREAVLIDLADRTLLEPRLLEEALRRVSAPEFLPEASNARETSAGRNIELLGESAGARARLARVIALAGARSGEHVTFRQLWAAISYALCAGKAQSTLQQELATIEDELGVAPLDNLLRGRGQGAVLRAARAYADPSDVPMPQLDEDLWSRGAPSNGEWEVDFGPLNPPAALFAQGSRDAAVERFRSLKRLVTLFHTAGDSILDALEASRDRPSQHEDEALRALVIEGLRRLYLTSAEEAAAPRWLRDGLPLWISHSYQDVAAGERPHVAVAAVSDRDLEVRRPVRPAWLAAGLGPLVDAAWLHHAPSGIALRVDDSLLSILRRATATQGPLAVPEPVQRFLARLAGWDERSGYERGKIAVLERPRGALIAVADVVRSADGAWSYGGADVG
jgi:hypothetical protein